MIYIVQPYYSNNGHFKEYCNNLLFDEDNIISIYCSNKNYKLKNSYFISSNVASLKNTFISKIFSRVLNSLKCIRYLNKNIRLGDTVHFIEFEPITHLYFYFRNKKKGIKIIQTVHSIQRRTYLNPLKNYISKIQRKIFCITLNRIKNLDTIFVVHYSHHKKQLNEIIKKPEIFVIPYPSPSLKVPTQKETNHNRLLIYGIVREDKGIFEFLNQFKNKKNSITIAGKIQDPRIHSLKSYRHYHFIDKYLDESEIKDLFARHDFLLLPYGKDYTGGAGPLKDSFAYGTPAICSNHRVFLDIIEKYKTGIIVNDFNQLEAHLSKIKDEDYKLFSLNALNYAQKYNWDYMKKKYYQLYCNK